MASIPLPALDVRPPVEQANPLQQYATLMGIRNEMQMQPLEQQAAQQKVEQGQLQLNDQKAMTSAMQQWDGKDYNDIIPLVLKNGGSAQAVMGLKSKMLEQQQSISTALKNNSDAANAQMQAQKTRGDLLDGALSTLIDPKQVSDEQLPQDLVQTANDLAQRGVLDPAHAQQAAQLAQSGNPAAIRSQLDLMRKSNLAQSQILDDAAKNANRFKVVNGTLYDLGGDKPVPALQGQLDPNDWSHAIDSVIPAMGPNAALNNRTHTLVDFYLKQGNAEAAQKAITNAADQIGAVEKEINPQVIGAKEQVAASEAQIRQSLSQGDPNAAGQLLVNGDATLSELKSRGATPEFITQALNAAHRLSGGSYNAQQAEAQFDVAKSPANVAFFGSSKSLTDKGGTLDQLQSAGKDLPGGLFPALNNIADWEKAATGSGPIAKYAATALGVADDYAKVMGGGQGSDTSRLQALNLIGAKQSPAQRAAAIEGIRNAVASQTNSRIGNNPVLQKMYGDQKANKAQPATGASMTITLPSGKKVTID